MWAVCCRRSGEQAPFSVSYSGLPRPKMCGFLYMVVSGNCITLLFFSLFYPRKHFFCFVLHFVEQFHTCLCFIPCVISCSGYTLEHIWFSVWMSSSSDLWTCAPSLLYCIQALQGVSAACVAACVGVTAHMSFPSLHTHTHTHSSTQTHMGYRFSQQGPS